MHVRVGQKWKWKIFHDSHTKEGFSFLISFNEKFLNNPRDSEERAFVAE